MDFRFTAEEEAFRREFVSWLKDNYPAGWNPDGYRDFSSPEEWARIHREFLGKMHKAGYSGLHYPKEYGGQGRGLLEEIVVLQSVSAHAYELRYPGLITLGMAAPTLLFCGSEEQKKEFVPKCLDGTHIWCQGFSEPNAGSDVANVSTKAVKDGDHYLVNGQKVWTSFAHLADYCLLLVRTDFQAKKHKGLSYLLLDMKLPGVEVRPITQISGEAEFNEIYLEDVKVPENMLVGREGQGWSIAITTLLFERTLGDVSVASAYLPRFAKMMEMAGQIKRSGRPIIEDPVFRQKMAQSYIELQVLKNHGLRNLSRQVKTGMPGPEGSIGKLLWSEPLQKISELGVDLQGPAGQLLRGSPHNWQDGFWQYSFLAFKGLTIAAGTSEIQRNIIGERVLGLPKDVSREARRQ